MVEEKKWNKPRESTKFKVGFKVRDKDGNEGVVVGVPRGEGPVAENLLVEFDGKPKNVLKKDFEVIEKKEHKLQ